MKRTSKPILVRTGQIDFLKVNADTWEWRDVYQWLLAQRWGRFSACIIGLYLGLNLLFAGAYALGGKCVYGMTPGSFWDGFFFSVQTLATVGYGHMYPQTRYGDIVTTVEIMTGVFLLAVTTGLIFVRFSRPAARILFSNSIVIAPFNGKPNLMLRVGNPRASTLVEAEFRLMFTRDEPVAEEQDGFRHFYALKLAFDRLSSFPAALTLRHLIDEDSPLFGVTPDALEASSATFMASIVGIETVIPASIQAQKSYSWRDVRFDERFVDMYTSEGTGKLTVDFGRLHETTSSSPTSDSD